MNTPKFLRVQNAEEDYYDDEKELLYDDFERWLADDEYARFPPFTPLLLFIYLLHQIM
jgi:hypothetical protein